MITSLDAYRVYFDWSNPANFNQLTIRGSKAYCNASRPKYVYAVGNLKLLPGNKYYWEISLENGVNFKIGVIRASASMLQDMEIKEAYTLSSRGFIQSATFEKGDDTQNRFCAGDKVGVFFDSEKGTLTYFLNDKRLGTFFISNLFKTEVFHPVACLLSEGELLSVL